LSTLHAPQLQSILQAVAHAFDVSIVCVAICGEHRVYAQVMPS